MCWSCNASGICPAFRTDLRQVFGFIQRAGDKDAEQVYTDENRTVFEALDEDAYDVISVLTGSEELAAIKETYQTKEGKVNMCEAIRGMIEDGRKRASLRPPGPLQKICTSGACPPRRSPPYASRTYPWLTSGLTSGKKEA